MERCKCWVVISNSDKAVCYGTKGMETCNCCGDVSKCDFYSEKRKEGKGMKTAEMWLKAQEDGYCYETLEGNKKPILYYQKTKGLFDEDNCFCGTEIWDYIDDLMNEQWRLRSMTKSEAEARFNIKIVGD